MLRTEPPPYIFWAPSHRALQIRMPGSFLAVLLVKCQIEVELHISNDRTYLTSNGYSSCKIWTLELSTIQAPGHKYDEE